MANIAPFFSVVIPTYNRASILSRSVDSVLSQTYQDFELIVVDNGSTDGTQQWLSDNYQDDRIVYHYQEGSGSPASPRNTGMSLAKGEWICFLDSDDKWHSDKLQQVFNKIQTNADTDVICHNENIYFEKSCTTGKLLKYGPSSKNMYKNMLVFGNRLSTSATSIRSEFLRHNKLKFDESNELSMVEDYDLWLRLAMHNANFIFLPKSLGFYTVGSSNMIANSGLFCKNLRNLLKLHAFHIQKFEKDKEGLWRLLELRFCACSMQYIDNKLSKQVIVLAGLLAKHPINLTRLVAGYAKRKLLLTISK